MTTALHILAASGLAALACASLAIAARILDRMRERRESRERTARLPIPLEPPPSRQTLAIPIAPVRWDTAIRATQRAPQERQ